ncbi:hypothetical protein J2X54_001280 [Duganella sp. 3397]|uniref:DUF5329 domain-containing protein n=1 Tax=Duganella sp. 3397 TaxID=2817732 RepID=UPI00285C5EA3|nr:DUF5329 family protein [Duganella sp. 3397]MDR7048832.1 hypothetical protein [Duganella sp. 3397]
MRTTNILAFYLALAFSTLATTASPALSAELPATSRAEIDTLLNRLGASGCQFSRNGSWYSSADARAHLAKKLNYLLEKNKLDGTEEFIKLGASSSSMSGKPYQVRCGDAQPVASQVWLTNELQAIRTKAAPAK